MNKGIEKLVITLFIPLDTNFEDVKKQLLSLDLLNTHNFLSNRHLNPAIKNLVPTCQTYEVIIEFECTDLKELQDKINDIIKPCEATIQKHSLYKLPKFAAFDMDSTLIQNECIDELAKLANVEEQVKEITEQAMQGKADFNLSLAKRVALLAGHPSSYLEDIKKIINLTEGVELLMKILKDKGCKLVLLSGGFTPIADYIRLKLDMDYAFANELEINPHDNTFTGKTQGTIVNGEMKRQILLTLAENFKIEKDDILAVGDGANDLLMLGEAGLGVAFQAKPIVQAKARTKLNQPSLLNLLYLFGIDNIQISEYLSN